MFNPNSKKGQTLRKIVDSLDREISLTQLHRMVRVTKQDKFFEEQGVDVSQASFSQKAELVSIPDNDKKIELIKDAMTNEWSVKDLREEVEKAKGKTGKGKSAKASAIKNSKLLQQLIAKEADMTDLKGTEQKKLPALLDDKLQMEKHVPDLDTAIKNSIKAIRDLLR